MEYRLSISLGFAEFSRDSSELTALLIQADKELYKAKYARKAARSGRKAP